MKKLALTVLSLILSSVVYSNRDDITSVSYGATAKNPLNITLQFDNVETNDKSPDYVLSNNLFSLAEFTVVN